MTSEAWVAIVSIVVSAAFSIGTIIIMTKERRSPLRQALYTKQLEIYSELVPLILKITKLILAALDDEQSYWEHESDKVQLMNDMQYLIEGEPLGAYQNQIDHEQVQSQVDQLYTEITTKMEIWANFLPKQISLDIWYLTKHIYDHGIDSERGDYSGPYESIQSLTQQTTNIIVGIRKHIGIDKLSSEILTLLDFHHANKKVRKRSRIHPPL